MQNLATLSLIAFVSGCATSGPNHLYTTVGSGTAIHDITAKATIENIIAATEHVAGLAYDFNTDHLFLRIRPAQIIRVIERPSGKALREMPLPAEMHTSADSADLAIRSSDRHIFAVNADLRSLTELTLFGKTLRQVAVSRLDAPITGLAFDQRDNRLLILSGTTVRVLDLQGAEISRCTLSAAINSVSLGYDSDAQHYFVPLADRASVGEFDSSGNLVKTHPASDGKPVTAIDAGVRSFVRVF